MAELHSECTGYVRWRLVRIILQLVISACVWSYNCTFYFSGFETHQQRDLKIMYCFIVSKFQHREISFMQPMYFFDPPNLSLSFASNFEVRKLPIHKEFARWLEDALSMFLWENHWVGVKLMTQWLYFFSFSALRAGVICVRQCGCFEHFLHCGQTIIDQVPGAFVEVCFLWPDRVLIVYWVPWEKSIKNNFLLFLISLCSNMSD